MKKRSDRTTKPQTHFEQVPVVVVKKIAVGHIAKVERARPDDGRVQPTSTERPQEAVPVPAARKRGR